MLTLGYRLADDRSASFRPPTSANGKYLQNFAINTSLAHILDSRVFNVLAECCPDGVILDLLAETALFKRIDGRQATKGGEAAAPSSRDAAQSSSADASATAPENCYFQLAGKPLADTVQARAKAAGLTTSEKRKRKRVEAQHGLASSDGADKENGKRRSRKKRQMNQDDQAAPVDNDGDHLMEDSKLGGSTRPEAKRNDPPKQHHIFARSRPHTQIALVRSRIFYARPTLDRSKRVCAGLPLSRESRNDECFCSNCLHSASRADIWNRSTKPSQFLRSPARKTNSTSTGRRTRAQHYAPRQHQAPLARRVRHVAKYIWPREFGLHNVFTDETDRQVTTQRFNDYVVRETEIHVSVLESVDSNGY